MFMGFWVAAELVLYRRCMLANYVLHKDQKSRVINSVRAVSWRVQSCLLQKPAL